MEMGDGAPELMQVEEVPGSPTEIADASSGEEPKIEKRKREEAKVARVRQGTNKAPAVPDTDDEELDSPSKRPSRGSDQPLSARELRELLQDHRRDMAEAWKTVEDRLGKLEQLNHNQRGELTSLAGRTKVNEKDVSNLKKAVEGNKTNIEKNEKKVEQLVEDVKNLRVKLEENKTTTIEGTSAPDPWAEYLRQQGQGHVNGAWPPPSRRVAGWDMVDLLMRKRAAGKKLSSHNTQIKGKFSLKMTKEPSSSEGGCKTQGRRPSKRSPPNFFNIPRSNLCWTLIKSQSMALGGVSG